jgi:hypothetical protein
MSPTWQNNQPRSSAGFNTFLQTKPRHVAGLRTFYLG